MFAQNQQNTLPATGNVGVGTTSPDVKLQVNGRMQVDSSLLVMDSAVFEKRAHIKDRIVVDEDAIIKGKLVARDKLKVKGTAKFEGNIKANANAKFLGNVKFPNLSTINNNDTTLLFLNQNGKVKKGSIVNLIEQVGSSPQAIPILQDVIYSSPVYCLQDPNGGTVYTSPSWERDAQRMFILNKTCHPDVRLGVGVKPKAKFHILTDNNSVLSQILIEKQITSSTATEKLMELDKAGNLYSHTLSLSPTYIAPNTFAILNIKNPNKGAAIAIDATGNTFNYNKLIYAKIDGNENTEIIKVEKTGESTPRFLLNSDGSFHIYNGTKKLLQLTDNGLLRSREVNVNVSTWPDYVFKEEYTLMPLEKLKQFIKTNGHLPNVPSAEEIEVKGVNLGNTAKITMEKVEELTLYLIQQQEAIEQLQKQLKQQQKLIVALKKQSVK